MLANLKKRLFDQPHDSAKPSVVRDPAATGIEGSVSKINFYSDETGFIIFELKQEQETATVKGITSALEIGDYVRCEGEYASNEKYGEQYQAQSIIPALPESTKGIQSYLGSGIITGIGKHTAKSIVKKFGTDTFHVIENEPSKLLSITGIGKSKLEKIKAEWDSHSAEREALVFLAGFDIKSRTAMNIIAVHKENTVNRVKNDPFILSESVYGIGFKRADEISTRMGIAKDSGYRIRAAIKHHLREAASSGHTAQFKYQLLADTVKTTGVGIDKSLAVLQNEIELGNFIPSDIGGDSAIYLPKLFRAESVAAKHLHRIATSKSLMPCIDFDQAVADLNSPFPYSESQLKALKHAIRDKVFVITGGPGMGKTSTIHGAIDMVTAVGASITLCAPTGRAAKRMADATKRPASTVHRVLTYNPEKRGFEFDENNPLETDFVVVDEASMLDISLFLSLLRAIPDHATLILVGDIDQLKSVGPGKVLQDIIDCGKVPVVYLTELHRRGMLSDITVNSHRVNNGEMPSSSNNGDFYVINGGSPEGVHDLLLKAVSERIPAKYGLNPITDVQVLAPMHKGDNGVSALNKDLQVLLNSNSHPQIKANYETYAPGDKVMHTKNNITLDAYNGDVGIVKEVYPDDKAMVVDYDGRAVEYEKKYLSQLKLAYATTIHKSQGSEYPAVVIPLTMQHYVMLERSTTYTGMTRGKQLVMMIVEENALKQALTKKSTGERVSNLAASIQRHYQG